MPLHLPGLSRRQFLTRTLASGVVVLTSCSLPGQEAAPAEERWALLSDPHIDADPDRMEREINMTDHLRASVAEVAGGKRAPLQVLINGDCAHREGRPEDYAQFVRLLQPLREQGVPIHCTMGNHDAREAFWQALPAQGPAPVQGRHLSIIESPLANWFLLDSLVKTNETPGSLGEAQRQWLATELDARASRPAIVVVHHHPMLPGAGPKPVGILDTEELLAILRPRRQVKAVLYGHTHTWQLTAQDGLHFINLPAVGYHFKETEVMGWVEARVRSDGLRLEVRSQDHEHPKHGELKELRWRT